MAKQLPKTDAIKALIAKATNDPDIDTSKMAVFEAVFANTLPLRRLGGLHAKARMGVDVFTSMIAHLDNGSTVPLAVNHDTEVMPAGKVLTAKLTPGAAGVTNLQGLFMLDGIDPALVGKVEASSIDEVSISIMPQQMLCSECGWDYLCDDATLENLWGCVCANDHEIGKNDVHVRLHGLQRWSELSLVGLGAVNGAKILPKAKHTYNTAAIAARGFDNSILELRASVADTREPAARIKEQSDMIEPEKYAAALTEAGIAKNKVETLTTDLAAANTKVTELNATVAALQGQIAATSPATATEKADLTAAIGLLDEIGAAALAATGATTGMPETVSAKVTTIREARAKLGMAIPAGGASNPAGRAPTDDSKPNFAAFKRA